MSCVCSEENVIFGILCSGKHDCQHRGVVEFHNIKDDGGVAAHFRQQEGVDLQIYFDITIHEIKNVQTLPTA